jgi:fumarylacetoacetase
LREIQFSIETQPAVFTPERGLPVPVLDETHDAHLTSFIHSAAAGTTDFPIQNLPFGVFRRDGGKDARIGIAIGDEILDVAQALEADLFEGDAFGATEVLRDGTLNSLMALGPRPAKALRLAVSRLLRAGTARQSDVGACLVQMRDVRFDLPAQIGNFTDFLTSLQHSTNVARIFGQPERANFKSLPIAYHGRASTVAVSDTPCIRPQGQIRPKRDEPPIFALSRQLDFEAEVGVFVASGNRRGKPIALADAQAHVFGLCLLNDWSARDIQSWESQPLGPFLAKSFLTSISPWIVTLDALAPFRVAATDRGTAPPLLAYLDDAADRSAGAIDIDLEVLISTPGMRDKGLAPLALSHPRFREQYWTIFQMIAHHTSNGCCLLPGDLFGSGTVSGTAENELGCLLEMTEAGRKPFTLPSGETRTFLENGDEVIMRGRCAREGFVSIGFGECRGEISAAD